MNFIDGKFKKYKIKYMVQCSLAALVIMIISVLLDVLLQTAILASVGATVFIAFTMPHTKRSKPRYILGGYTWGLLIGTICHLLSYQSVIYVQSVFIAIAIGLCIFFMVITNTEHPPAAGFAMGIVIEGIDIYTIVVVYIAIVLILVGKRLLSRWLIDLL